MACLLLDWNLLSEGFPHRSCFKQAIAEIPPEIFPFRCHAVCEKNGMPLTSLEARLFSRKLYFV
jgi:hypothetical protein